MKNIVRKISYASRRKPVFTRLRSSSSCKWRAYIYFPFNELSVLDFITK